MQYESGRNRADVQISAEDACLPSDRGAVPREFVVHAQGLTIGHVES